jgi:GNAT superfamily N-acetyltransferase
MSPGDATAVAALAVELGYDISAETAASQIGRLGRDSAAFVAFVAKTPAGWVYVSRTDLLQATPFAEIGGLVVTAALRGAGVGRELMAAAEAWAVEHGLHEVRLRSRVAREDAHRFYERLGYEMEKTSFTFRRQLTNSSPRRASEE